MALMTKRFNEHGAIGGVEGFAFGILLFVFGTLMIINAWAVVNGKMTASAAAREAARTYVEARNQRDAEQQARLAALVAVSEPRRSSTTVEFATNNTYIRCGEITATVHIAIPRISLPLIGGTGGSFPVTATHTEIIDPYRSGLASTAQCS